MTRRDSRNTVYRLTVGLLFGLIVCDLIQYQFTALKLDLSKERMGVCVLIAIIYAFSRGFNPLWNPKYAQWLLLSPWSGSTPLPLRPLLLRFSELMVIGLSCGTLWGMDQLSAQRAETVLSGMQGYWLLPAVVFFAIYTFMLWLSVSHSIAKWIPFLWLATFYPYQNFFVAMAVLMGIYLLELMALKTTLKETAKKGLVLDRDLASDVWAWPLTHMKLRKPDAPDPGAKGRVIHLALLLSLWCYGLSRVADYQPKRWIIYGIGILAAFAYWLTYVGNTRPPITLLGRLTTGRLVLSKYDRVLVVPALLALEVFAIPHLTDMWELSNLVAASVALFCLVVTIGIIGPRLMKDWEFCGIQSLIKRPSKAPEPVLLNSSDETADHFLLHVFELLSPTRETRGQDQNGTR